MLCQPNQTLAESEQLHPSICETAGAALSPSMKIERNGIQVVMPIRACFVIKASVCFPLIAWRRAVHAFRFPHAFHGLPLVVVIVYFTIVVEDALNSEQDPAASNPLSLHARSR